MHEPCGQSQQPSVALRLRREQHHVLIRELLPWSALSAHAELRSRIIECKDFTIGMAFLAHHLGADLTKADAVSGAATVENQAIALVAHVVQVALQAVPSDVAADGRAKCQ